MGQIGLRIRGQECQVRVTSNGALVQTLTALKSIEFTANVEKQEENYMGETGPRLDEIWMGMDGSGEWDLEDDSTFTLVDQVFQRAKRLSPADQITVNIATTVTKPDGTRFRVLIPNVTLSAPKWTFPGRKEFAKFRTDFHSVSEYQAVRL